MARNLWPRDKIDSRDEAIRASRKFVEDLMRYERWPTSREPGDDRGRFVLPAHSSSMTSPAALCAAFAF